jgi:hypothetical protein
MFRYYFLLIRSSVYMGISIQGDPLNHTPYSGVWCGAVSTKSPVQVSTHVSPSPTSPVLIFLDIPDPDISCL